MGFSDCGPTPRVNKPTTDRYPHKTYVDARLAILCAYLHGINTTSLAEHNKLSIKTCQQSPKQPPHTAQFMAHSNIKEKQLVAVVVLAYF